MRRDLDNGRVEPGIHEETSNHQGASAPKLEVRSRRACSIRVADDGEIGDGALVDRPQDLWDQSAAFLSQLVRFEPKVQREALWRRREGVQRVLEDPPDLRLAQNRHRRW